LQISEKLWLSLIIMAHSDNSTGIQSPHILSLMINSEQYEMVYWFNRENIEGERNDFFGGKLNE